MRNRITLTLLAAALAAGCQSGDEPGAPAANADAPTITQLPESPPEPAATAPATLLGEPIESTNADEVQQQILSTLFDRYADDNGIEATAGEIDAFLDNMRKGMAEEGLSAGEEEPTPEEAAQVAEMRSEMARSVIRQWKINKSLYEQYGGRIIYQQFGPEPLDAYRQFLEAQRDAGSFSITDPAFSAAFWSYFTDETKHDFIDPEGEDAKRAFTRPPWEG